MSLESLRDELNRMAAAMRSLRREAQALRKDNAALRAELAAGRAEAPPAEAGAADAAEGLTFVVSPKGALTVLGLARLPTTLYASQWLRLIAAREAVRAFVEGHRATLRDPRPGPPRRRRPEPRQRQLRLRP